MRRIQRLPVELANQIAAGEVIERPASVVKELLENSLDAGSKNLHIHLQQGGKQSIRIQDDGHGIHPDDLALALSPHATSKIAHPSDLAQIATLGFRGEALASMASVSKFKIISQCGDCPAKQATVQGREMEAVVKPAAHPRGTTVELQDLFYNTPARRKFLKSDRTELFHIDELIKRLALVNPEVSFHVHNDNKLIKRYLASRQGLESRIQNVLSKTFMDAALSLDESITQARLYGFIAKGDYARSSSDQQFFYVNGRMVRDKVISHAIRLAYEGEIYPGRFPSYALYLELDPAGVDVNVHPTKHEVRFRDARLIHDFVSEAVSKALRKTLKPAALTPLPRVAAVTQTTARPVETVAMPAFTFSEAIENEIPRMTVSTPPQQNVLGRVIAALNDDIIITQRGEELIAIQWHKTLVRYTQTRWQQALLDGDVPTQPLLAPVNLIATQYQRELEELGFDIQVMGPGLTVIRAMPRILQGLDLAKALQDIAPYTDLMQHFARHWAYSHPRAHSAITQTLSDCLALLGEQGIVHRRYLGDELV